MEPATRRRARGPASKRWPALTSRSPRGAAHPGNGVIAPFHGGRPRNRGVKDTHRPPFSAPSSRRRPSETAIRTALPALTLKSSRPGTTNRSRLRDGVGRYESDRRGPGQGGRARLAQCEPSATQSASPRAVRAQRDTIHLSSIRASPPGAMRAQVTSPKRLPRGWGGLAGGGTGRAKESAIQDMAGRPRGWRHRVCRPKRLPRGVGDLQADGAVGTTADGRTAWDDEGRQGRPGRGRRAQKSRTGAAARPAAPSHPRDAHSRRSRAPSRRFRRGGRDGRGRGPARGGAHGVTSPSCERLRRVIRRMCTFRRSRAIFLPVSARGVAGTCARGRPWGNLALVRATARVRTSLLLSRRGGA